MKGGNTRAGMAWRLPEDVRDNQRSVAERDDSALKPNYGGRSVRVRGHDSGRPKYDAKVSLKDRVIRKPHMISTARRTDKFRQDSLYANIIRHDTQLRGARSTRARDVGSPNSGRVAGNLTRCGN